MRNRHPVALVTCALLALLGAANPAAAQEPSAESALRTRVDEIVEPFLAVKDFQGVIAVQRDGETPLIAAYGLASQELGAPHTADGIFQIGSVSKQFTAVAILLLEQDGLLSTDDPVTRHLPGFTRGDEITIQQLLTHTSGVRDIFSLERFGRTAGRTGRFEEVIDDLARREPDFDPGSRYAYSNGGYAVLAAIIERVSGTQFDDYLERRLFAPLGMTSTAHDGPGPAVARRVPGYDPWGHVELSPAVLLSPAFSTGSGSLWSSAADLLAWNTALHTGKLLSEEAYEKLTRDYGHAYGYGVSVFQRFGRAVVGHDGRIDGYASDVARYVDDRVTVAILSNVQSAVRDQIRRLVAAAVFDEDYSVPDPRVAFRGASDSVADLVGVYSFGPGFNVSISSSDGRLLARANEGGFSELVPVSDTEWFSRVLYATVSFRRDANGSVDGLVWGRGEGAPVGRRLP